MKLPRKDKVNEMGNVILMALLLVHLPTGEALKFIQCLFRLCRVESETTSAKQSKPESRPNVDKLIIDRCNQDEADCCHVTAHQRCVFYGLNSKIYNIHLVHTALEMLTAVVNISSQ